MKVKFNDLDQMEKFIQIASELQSGVVVECGSMASDAKSPVGMMCFNTNTVLDVLVVEPYVNEAEELKDALNNMGVLVSE